MAHLLGLMFLDHFHQLHQFDIVSALGLWNAAPAKLCQQLKKLRGQCGDLALIQRFSPVLRATHRAQEILPDDDPDFKNIAEETKDQVKAMYMSAVEQEKAWAKYIFKDGSIIGLNEQLLSEYIEYIAGKRMTAVGIEHSFNTKINPLPWTNAWIAGSDVQVAPQETEITSYQTGTVNMDVTEDTFKGFKL